MAAAGWRRRRFVPPPACRRHPAISPCSPHPKTLPGTAALPRSDFERIDGELRAYDEKRENVIKRSRDIQKLSKQVGLHAVCGSCL